MPKVKKLKLAIGSDHGGFELKTYLIKYFEEYHPNIIVDDLGTKSTESVDYPDYGKKVAKSILAKENDCGVLVCGTGIGISISANRFKGIRAALVYDEFTAKMAKAHNNANILCFGGRNIPLTEAKKLIEVWLDTEFEGDRHLKRLKKLDL